MPTADARLCSRMPSPERAILAPDDELNQQAAAHYLGVGRSTLAALTAAGLLPAKRLSPRNIRYRVGDLREYERSVTTGPTTTTPTTGAKKRS